MKIKIHIVQALFICFFMSSNLAGQNYIELGRVDWIRDLDKGVQICQSENKPIFILFQEVPGCSTCRNFGRQVLSHPLIVEAIETLFVPVAIFNNKKGKDGEALTFFQEPPWNNPVVRIVDHNKRDVVSRVSGNYTASGVVDAMIQALEKSNVSVPVYLHMLQSEFSVKENEKEVYFSMYCFWTGEKTYGELHGVGETEAGYMEGKEVVRVRYNPDQISLSELINAGNKTSCAQGVYLTDTEQGLGLENMAQNRMNQATDFRADKEAKYYLSKSLYRFIPMTPSQAARANSLIGKNKNIDHLLSGRQLQLLNYIKNNSENSYQSMIGKPIEKSWSEVEQFLLR